MKYSIKLKMTLLVAVIIIGMMALLLLASFFLAEPVMIYRQKGNIQTLYHSLQQNYTDDASALEALVQGYEEGNFLQVEIMDGEGALIYTSGRKMTEGFEGFPGHLPQNFPNRPEMQYSFADFESEPSVVRESRGEGDILSIRGVFYTAVGNRYVSIQTPVKAIYDTVSVMNQLTLIISITVVLAGCLAAFLYASKFSRPIIDISNTAKKVAALDFSAPAEEQSSTAEIADLAVSINAMSGQLEEFIRQLMEKNGQLAEDNERLAKSEEARRSFIANVSHDLKSPLAVLSGYAEMLKEHTAGVEPEACYDVIIQETETMDRMIRSMLEVSALEHGLATLQKQPMSLSALVEELCARERPLLEKKGLTFGVKIAPDLQIDGEEDTLSRAVQNILQNAVSHTPAGGAITVGLKKEGEQAVLEVYNEGAPIPEEKLERIWDSFYRTDEARTRDEQSNLGLGLYIVKTVVSAHGGSCRAANGQGGVVFQLCLPLKI